MNAGIIAASFVVITIITCITIFFCLRSKRELRQSWLHGRAAGEASDQLVPNNRGLQPTLSRADISKLISFLEEADNAYIRAYQYRSLGELIQFITRELAIEMQQKITYYNDKIWGTPAHRHRTWSVVSTDGAVITVRKELTFKKVKYGKILVKLGDDSVEYWKVIYDSLDKRYKIQEITC